MAALGITGDWRAVARDLRHNGFTEREIAEKVGKSRSSVHDAVTASAPEEPVADNAAPDEIPGQVTIDGHEVPLAAPDPADDLPPLDEIRVAGTAQLGLFNAGGKQPQTASLRLSGGRVLLVDGQAFRKGDTIRFEGTAVVVEVGQRDKRDEATGIPVSAEQKHVAQITDLRVVRPDA